MAWGWCVSLGRRGRKDESKSRRKPNHRDAEATHADALLDRLQLLLVHEVDLVEEDAVREGQLLHGLVLHALRLVVVQVLDEVLGVHHREDGVEEELLLWDPIKKKKKGQGPALAQSRTSKAKQSNAKEQASGSRLDLLLHEEGLGHRRRVRQPRRLDEDGVEPVALALEERGEDADEVPAHGAADAACWVVGFYDGEAQHVSADACWVWCGVAVWRGAAQCQRQALGVSTLVKSLVQGLATCHCAAQRHTATPHHTSANPPLFISMMSSSPKAFLSTMPSSTPT